MIDKLVSDIFCVLLTIIGVFLSIYIVKLYRIDKDSRKIMFVVGFLFFLLTYIVAVPGIDSSSFSMKIYEWCSLPVLFAGLLGFSGSERKPDYGKYLFTAVTTVSVIMFFVPFSFPPYALLLGGLVLASVLAVRQNKIKFDFAAAISIPAMPCLAISLIAIGVGSFEIAFFSGLISYVFLLFGFEAAKRQIGSTSSIFALKKELQNAKKSIKETESRLQNIAENTTDWIWETDLRGNFTYSNLAIEKILGYTLDEIMGVDFSSLLVLEQRKSNFLAELVSHIDKKENISKKCIGKNGKLVTLESSCFPKINEKGHIIGYIGVDRDITERLALERKLFASERFATIGKLATMVAHDLRNPIQGIATASYVLKNMKSDELNSKEIFILKQIDEAVKYSEKIVNDLLDYARPLTLDKEMTNPQLIIQTAMETITFPDNIVIVNNTENRPNIQVDKNKIKRLFINLIQNAVDAMPNGGTLTFKSLRDKDNLLLTISDNGTGMPPEVLRELWTPLLTTKAKGMGLGLPICNRIIKAHNGKILVDSEINKGTTFTVILPICEKEKIEMGVIENEKIIEVQNQKSNSK